VKKLFALLLALVFMLAMTGSAFAQPINANKDSNIANQTAEQENEAEQKAEVEQEAEVEQKAEAKTGNANAVGNASYTEVWTDQSAKDNKGIAINFSKTTVTNEGKAIAKSGDAVAVNKADVEQEADIEQDIEQENNLKQDIKQDIKKDDKKKDDKKKKKDDKKKKKK